MTYLASFLAVCFALMAPLSSAQTATSMPVRIGRAAKFYHNRDGFMGMVAVARNHQLLFQSGYGYANLEWQVPFTPDTRFRIGSLTKQFTAAAILLLQQDGKLKTSDPLSRHYPNSPAAWSALTLRNLLTHTSGIPDVDFGLVLKESLHTPEGLMKGVLDKPLEFQPGTKFEYANVNYMLLGRVVEEASGEPYCQFLQERIFHPLRLTQTGCDWSSSLVQHRAYGYRPSAHGPTAVENDDLSSIAGAGNLYSSANDLVRWTEALQGGGVLSPASLKEMVTPFLNGYSYGLQEDGEGGSLDISHNGAVDGFFSCLDYIPRTKTTVVVLSNLVAGGNSTSPGTFALDTELVRLGMDEGAILPSEGKETQVPAKTLNAYVGRYRSTDPQSPQVLVVTAADGHLYLQNDGASTTPAQLRAETSSRFYVPNQEIELTFDLGAGNFQFADFSQGWATTFTKDSEPGAKALRREHN